MRKFPLKRREVTRLLEANGFVVHRRHGSHVRYHGFIDGITRHPEIDQAVDEFPADTHRVLGNILSQLGFFDDELGISHDVAWQRFYGDERDIARRAQIPYRAWSDLYWEQWYRGKPPV